ncbi:unnamed protein product [Moneuplotes crassus]|uniref:Uncharacterized protein n=1 Tax=Euplotes crassus TaxID=5936 RepID=A0AAD1UJQ5_EUPCR|nr:unnamed protein product [Moneuplotes crassus]
MEKKDDFFDLVKSDDYHSEVEMNDLVPEEYKSPGRISPGRKRGLVRPQSGYLFPMSRVMSSQAHEAIIERYFDDPHSSLNKSFMMSKEKEDAAVVTPLTIAFKVFCLLFSTICNSCIVVVPNYLAKKIYFEEQNDENFPVVLNCWRLQCAALCFLIFALFRKIFCMDIFFQNGFFTKLTLHATISGVALAIWSTGVMYAAEISSPFNSYLLGYAFPPILSGLIIVLGLTICRQPSQNNAHLNQISNIESHMSVTDNKSREEKVFQPTEYVRSRHVSQNEKYGTILFYVGILILILARILNPEGHEEHKSYLIGDAIAFGSAFFGIIFQWIFIYYSMRQIYKIIEFFTVMYLSAAAFMTIVTLIFFDDSEYKLKSICGWAVYPADSISLILGFLILGILCGLGTKVFQIVKGEKFLPEDKIYYSYLLQPIIACTIGYYLYEEKYDIPDVYSIIAGCACFIGCFILSRK